MADPYTPPAGDLVELAFAGSYTPPAGDEVALAFGVPSEPGFIFTGVLRSFGLAWGEAEPRDARWEFRWNGPVVADKHVGMAWGQAEPRDHAYAMRWQEIHTADRGLSLAWNEGEPHGRAYDLPWASTPAKDRATALAWGEAEPHGRAFSALWRTPLKRDVSRNLAWGEADPHGRAWSALWRTPAPHDTARTIPWDEATPLRQQYVLQPPSVPVVPPRPCYVPPPGDLLQLAMRGTYEPPAGDQVRFDFRCGDMPRIYHLTRTRIVQHTVTVCRLPDRLPLNCASAGMKLDRDSWCWSIDLNILDRASYHAVMPDASGPKLVEINASGHVFVMLVERASERRVATSPTRFAASGRSRTALLAAPYAVARPYVATEPMTAQQAAVRELEGTGFALDWQIDDWLLPVGAWRYENETPMSAIKRIANAAGAIVQSHPKDETVIVKSAYPAAPWAWASEAPALILDGVSLIEMGREWSPGPQYLGVYVSGETKGVLVNVVREGGGGSPYAQMVVDPLITDIVPARGRGLQVIADSENMTLEPMLLPLLPAPDAPGIIEPATLVQVEDPVHGVYRAVSDSSAISISLNESAVTIRQTVELARHYPVDLT